MQHWFPCDAPFEYAWKFNHRYSIVSGHKYFSQETGLHFTSSFPSTIHRPLKYVTRFGFSFAYNGIMYGNFNNVIRNMVSRHFKVKVPEDKKNQPEVPLLDFADFDAELRYNQKVFLDVHMKRYVDWFLCEYGEHDYNFDLREAALLLADEAHFKRMLRLAGVDELHCSAAWVRKRWVDIIEWKLKYIEIAKISKDGRVIVDCNVINSLPRVHFANSFKLFTADKMVTRGDIKLIFRSSPDPVKIHEVFRAIDAFNGGVLIQNFSDDAIITFDYNGVKKTYNVDISSNDSSHSLSTFEAYAKCSCMTSEQYANLVSVVMSPFKIYSEDKKQKVVFQPITGYLPSGIGDTSVCNNMVYCLLAYSLSLRDHTDVSSLTLAGFDIGFRFTYEYCSRNTDYQFLKHSPVCTMRFTMPNLGILLRYSGGVEGDLMRHKSSKNETLHECALRFQSLLTFGFFKYYSYPPLERLCPHLSSLLNRDLTKSEELIASSHFSVKVERTRVLVTREEFYSRYDVDPWMIDEFESLVSQSGVGTLCYCRLVDIVMEKDYGLIWN
jgi:hypothetical protein